MVKPNFRALSQKPDKYNLQPAQVVNLDKRKCHILNPPINNGARDSR